VSVDSVLVDRTNVYWLRTGSLMSVPRAGGDVRTVATWGDSAHTNRGEQALAQNDRGIYWATGGTSLLLLPAGGGPPVSLIPSVDSNPNPGRNFYPVAVALDSVNAYFVNDSTELFAVALDGTPPILPVRLSGPVATGGMEEGYGVAIAVNGGYLYWTSEFAGTVGKVPVTGGDATILATGQAHATGIATDGTSVYWVCDVAVGSVVKVSVDGGTPTTIAVAVYPRAVALDDTNVYWANRAPSAQSANGVFKAPK
jgi:hypothetical protein